MNDRHIFIILAAGKGTRMKSDKAKVMHEIAYKPMLFYPLELAKKFSANINVVTHESYADLREFLSAHYADVGVCLQAERLGTGHAVKSALSTVKDDSFVYILYGDTPFISAEIVERLQEKISATEGLVLVGFYGDQGEAYGRLITEGDKLVRIVENSEATEEEKEVNLYNSGIIAIYGKWLKDYVAKLQNNNSKKEYFLTDIIALMARDNLPVSYITCEEKEVLGVNSKVELAVANRIKQDELRQNALNQGVTLVAPETVFLNPEIDFGRDVIIEPNVVIKGKTKIADKVVVRSFSVLEDNVAIGEKSKIGPFARLRPNTEISGECNIGNFVEIKNSRLANNSKVNHLSYIGDSEIGSGVNIGAGTITCNYDGYNKYKTIIGDNVFIGSNSALVAPVSIAENALIAAGSTVTNNVEKDDLAIARSKQVNLKSMAKKIKEKKAKEKNARK